jgi:[ribosomal protein S18]-alanine N-acetyltransferase
LNARPIIRVLESRDVETILAIQTGCPEVAQWIAEDYLRVANGEMVGWVAEEEGRVLGFLIARRIMSEIEVLNLAVEAASRCRSIGSSLLHGSLEWANEFQAERAILEVRESNLSALHFYERRGFQAVGRRARYYTSPVEDALVLSKSLLPVAG